MGIILITAVLLWSFTVEASEFSLGSLALNIETGQVGEVLRDNRRPGQISLAFRDFKKKTEGVSVIPEESLSSEVPEVRATFLLGHFGLRSVSLKAGDFIIGKDKNLYYINAVFKNEALQVVVTGNEWGLKSEKDFNMVDSLAVDLETRVLRLDEIEAVELSGCYELCVGDYLKPKVIDPLKKKPKHSFVVVGLFSNGYSIVKYRRGHSQGVLLSGLDELEYSNSLYYIPLM